MQRGKLAKHFLKKVQMPSNTVLQTVAESALVISNYQAQAADEYFIRYSFVKLITQNTGGIRIGSRCSEKLSPDPYLTQLLLIKLVTQFTTYFKTFMSFSLPRKHNLAYL
jgi:hypothetical protein